MDEKLVKQLTRQLKLLNFWITLFGSLLLVLLLVMIFLLFKVVTFVQDTSQRLSDIQQKTEDSLDLKKRVCDSSSIGGLLDGRSQLCDKQ